ncbi:hypothetical protein HJG60_008780 [Phyllostomus discolor]|uniref:Uncharacterized protein n=1 Tax=Phyllostomus discolor TaxID=89673 RepID=A0A834DIX4_9CHIR|nr:hypothetical protein HJG60_008780 [Phyllostomus discolor]
MCYFGFNLKEGVGWRRRKRRRRVAHRGRPLGATAEDASSLPRPGLTSTDILGRGAIGPFPGPGWVCLLREKELSPLWGGRTVPPPFSEAGGGSTHHLCGTFWMSKSPAHSGRGGTARRVLTAPPVHTSSYTLRHRIWWRCPRMGTPGRTGQWCGIPVLTNQRSWKLGPGKRGGGACASHLELSPRPSPAWARLTAPNLGHA